MLTAGDPAPDFDLPRPTADGAETYRVSAAARDGPVVLAFYPLADTAGAADLLRELAAYGWADVTDRFAVLAVGVGDAAAHERLADAVDVPFPLLVDRDGFFADRYGLLEPVADGVGMRPALFVVDRRCTIEFGWRRDDADEPPPLAAVRDALASA